MQVFLGQVGRGKDTVCEYLRVSAVIKIQICVCLWLIYNLDLGQASGGAGLRFLIANAANIAGLNPADRRGQRF